MHVLRLQDATCRAGSVATPIPPSIELPRGKRSTAQNGDLVWGTLTAKYPARWVIHHRTQISLLDHRGSRGLFHAIDRFADTSANRFATTTMKRQSRAFAVQRGRLETLGCKRYKTPGEPGRPAKRQCSRQVGRSIGRSVGRRTSEPTEPA